MISTHSPPKSDENTCAQAALPITLRSYVCVCSFGQSPAQKSILFADGPHQTRSVMAADESKEHVEKLHLYLWAHVLVLQMSVHYTSYICMLCEVYVDHTSPLRISKCTNNKDYLSLILPTETFDLLGLLKVFIMSWIELGNIKVTMKTPVVYRWSSCSTLAMSFTWGLVTAVGGGMQFSCSARKKNVTRSYDKMRLKKINGTRRAWWQMPLTAEWQKSWSQLPRSPPRM